MSKQRPLLSDEEFLIRRSAQEQPPTSQAEEKHAKPEEESAELLERFVHQKKPADAFDTLAEDPSVFMMPR